MLYIELWFHGERLNARIYYEDVVTQMFQYIIKMSHLILMKIENKIIIEMSVRLKQMKKGNRSNWFDNKMYINEY